MTDKQINKWLRRRFTQVGWVLVAYYAIMNLLAVAAMALDSGKQMLWAFAAGDYGATLDYDAIAGNAWGYILTILVGLLILHVWKGREYWNREIFARSQRMDLGVFLCALVFCMGTQMVNSIWVGILETILNRFGLSAMTILESVSGESDTLSMFLYASILAPIGEEILFRGYVLRSLKPFGKRFAIWGSAILFGMFHGNLLQTPYAVLMGLALGYVAVEYSIGWSILLHMFNNLVLADLLTRLTASWSDMAFSMLNLVLFGGAFLISLGVLIRKRQDLRAYRRSEWMDRRVWKCFLSNTGILTMTAIAVYSMVSLLFLS